MKIDIARPFKVDIVGRGSLSITPKDYVRSGGEASIFRKGPSAIKIWTDPDRAQANRMPERIGILCMATDLRAEPRIVGPEALVMSGGSPVGFLMPWVNQAIDLPLLFTADGRAGCGFNDATALYVLVQMRSVVCQAHAMDIVLGDANEFNIMAVADAGDIQPRYIDVDSWVPSGFAGDKVLPAIFDEHSPPFTKEADWFAWAVVAFQLLTGLHPYRGSHPTIARNDMPARKRANASAFSPDVRLPATMRPIDAIPPGLRDWLRAVLQYGERTPPPRDFNAYVSTLPAIALPQPLLPNGAKPLWEITVPIERCIAGVFLETASHKVVNMTSGAVCGNIADPYATFFTMPDGKVGWASYQDGRLDVGTLWPTWTKLADLQIRLIGDLWGVGNRLFAEVEDGLLELKIVAIGGKMRVMCGQRWSVPTHSTVIYNGAAIADALGAKFLVVPFGGSSMGMIRVPPLDAYRVSWLTCHGRLAVAALVDKQGDYKRAVIVIDERFTGATITISDADNGELTDVITHDGDIVRIDASGQIEVSSPMHNVGARLVAPPCPNLTRLILGREGLFGLSPTHAYKVTL